MDYESKPETAKSWRVLHEKYCVAQDEIGWQRVCRIKFGMVKLVPMCEVPPSIIRDILDECMKIKENLNETSTKVQSIGYRVRTDI